MNSLISVEGDLNVQEPVAVLGVGVEGRETIAYLLRNGATEVTALDQHPIDGLPPSVATVFGPHYDQQLDRFATIFRSPGIRPDGKPLADARTRGAVVTSATDFFLSHCPAPVVGITGTVGKGTAASATAEMLTRAGFTVHLGGNIGTSPLAFLDRVKPADRVVLEISSFQAMDLTVSPQVAVILKTTVEHLDWHRDVEEYRTAKAQLLAQQRADHWVIYNADAPGSAQIARASAGRKIAYSMTGSLDHGMYLKENRFHLRQNGRDLSVPMTLSSVRLKGRFNLENLAAAMLASLQLGAPLEAAARAGEAFNGLPHRLEFVTETEGIQFYNDSYATRPEATIGALSAFDQEPLALILGGSEKNVDFDELARVVTNHRQLVHVGLIGATAKRLRRAIEEVLHRPLSMKMHETLEPAVQGAFDSLGGGGTVMLSPACASFGLFPNYKVRGERFRSAARKIAGDDRTD